MSHIPALRRLARSLPAGELLLSGPVLDRCATDKWFASRRPDAVALFACDVKRTEEGNCLPVEL